ncbi:MAG: hypothetical protein UY41_C0012G0022 [Candidatus Moranbacteria bacterium GW2011_GWE1_49_15]|nr:MAG: hypothetical protein UX75_C0013G0017 [Candidatus Moranbacteria bacterium GW2011_GWE2_47_10]KKW06932.1 MAG: hypothetical protein UY41_C0012G0022 [Candidatus Moranbacteria bacterium GW2011_GWE1_49_15]HBP01223.1 hypothetical protein [Candidatus Moranbacteria bacterium]
MKRYEILPHTADVRLLVEGTSLEELFEAVLEGLAEILSPGSCEKNRKEKMDVERYLSIFSDDFTPLLIDFLSEVLTCGYLNKVVFCKVDFLVLEKKVLKAKIRGMRASEITEDVKAVTYHEAEVVKNKRGNFETVVVFDI